MKIEYDAFKDCIYSYTLASASTNKRLCIVTEIYKSKPETHFEIFYKNKSVFKSFDLNKCIDFYNNI